MEIEMENLLCYYTMLIFKTVLQAMLKYYKYTNSIHIIVMQVFLSIKHIAIKEY